MKKIRDWHRKNFMFAEFILAVAITILVWFVINQFSSQQSLETLLKGSRQLMYSTIASIGGSLLGFVLTAVSVVIVFGQLPKLRTLRESSQYESVFAIFFQAVGCLAVITVWAFVGLLIDRDGSPVLFVTYCTLFLMVLCAFRVYRCIWIMKAITVLAVKKPAA